MALSILKTKQNKFQYSELPEDPIQHTVNPICTGSSVIGIKFKGGIIVGCDDLISYGSMAKFKKTKRIEKLAEHTVMASSGEFSDFQELLKKLKTMRDTDMQKNDGIIYTPKEYGNYVARIQYYRRCKVNPYLLNNVVAGYTKEGGAYLAKIDQFGTYIEHDYVTTGFAGYLGAPIIENESKPDQDENAARQILIKCFTNLFYRDCRASDTIQLAVITDAGVKFEEPFRIEGVWNYKKYAQDGSEFYFRQ